MCMGKNNSGHVYHKLINAIILYLLPSAVFLYSTLKILWQIQYCLCLWSSLQNIINIKAKPNAVFVLRHLCMSAIFSYNTRVSCALIVIAITVLKSKFPSWLTINTLCTQWHQINKVSVNMTCNWILCNNISDATLH